MLLWQRQVPFCHSLMFKKFFSLPNHSLRVCVKGKGINRGTGCGLEIPGNMAILKSVFKVPPYLLYNVANLKNSLTQLLLIVSQHC